MNLERIPLITKDAFEFYEKVIRRVFGLACLYGQVIKLRRNEGVVKVERRIRIGSAWRWEQALRGSEDSSQLNTSFVERLNLTIRQGSAYLCRRTICQARWKQRLEDHFNLLRCQANAFGSLTTFGGGSTRMTASGWQETHKSSDWFALCRQGKGETVELITAGGRCIGADRI